MQDVEHAELERSDEASVMAPGGEGSEKG